MTEIVSSDIFDRWLTRLRDRKVRATILVRITRLQSGNPGDVKPVGDGVSEARIDMGPGYRIYFMQRGPLLIVLLAGGSKSTQPADIAKAKTIAKTWEG